MYNEFEVKRDGQIDPSFKRKVIIKKTRYAVQLTRLVIAAYSRKYVLRPIQVNIEEQARRAKLTFFDWLYETNLKAQYDSGKRTQRILSTKRSLGLS